MIRRVLLAAAFVVVVASAEVTTAQPMGSPLEVWVDVDGAAYLFNTTSSPLSFDGYQITSDKGELDPANWDSISDRIPARISELIGSLGAGSLTFGEANPNESNLAELNLGAAGTLAAGAKFSLGHPFKTGVDLWGLSFFYKLNTGPNAVEGVIGPRSPEPSTFLLAALAGLGLLAFRARPRR